MLPHDSVKYWIIILGVIILFVLGSTTLLSKLAVNPQNTNQESFNQRAFPSKTVSDLVSSDMKVLYKDQNDREGRTIIYDSKKMKYPKAGISYSTLSPSDKVRYIVGLFQGWEAIPNSKDKYILLKDSLNNNSLLKARVAFEKSPLFHNGVNATAIGVENLYKNILENPKKHIMALNDEQLNTIIKTGDAVVVVPLIQEDTSAIYDADGIVTASWLIVRRYDGLEVIKDYL